MDDALSKVPVLTLIFWVIKILSTTLGESDEDALSMSMNLGYLLSTLISLVFSLLLLTRKLKQNYLIHFYIGQPLLPQLPWIQRWQILRHAH